MTREKSKPVAPSPDVKLESGLDRSLDRILERGDIATLSPLEIARVVDEVGVEDAGEIAAMMTAEQLAGVLDQDLWTAPATSARTDERSERFDDARFGLWLEVLLEMGTREAAERLLHLDADDDGVVALGLSRMFHVFSTDALAREVRDDDDDEGAQVEKLLASSSILEIDGWFLVARVHTHVDAAHAIVAELDANHRDDLDRILGRIAAATTDAAADAGGLVALLSADEQLESDVAGARLDRREAAGFVSPADARAFLALCDKGAEVAGVEAIVRPYLGAPATRTSAAVLAFLANVLVAHEKREPADAARFALAYVMRGMSLQLSPSSSSSSSSPPAAAPNGAAVIAAFAIGWRRRGRRRPRAAPRRTAAATTASRRSASRS